MKKKIFTAVLCVLTALCTGSLFAEENPKLNKVTVEITKIGSAEGEIILCIYDSAKAYDKRISYQETWIHHFRDGTSGW